MKTIKITALAALTVFALLFAACSETESIDESLAVAEKSTELEAVLGDSCILDGNLTVAEVAGLMEMREEEKLAGDVYTTFFEKYEQVIFTNISKSEAAHTGAVLYLLNGYGLEDPALEGLGQFTNPLFTSLFEQLTLKGSENLVEALKVGAFIEEYDINDLMHFLEETENANVARVYGNLLKASKVHLRAFTNVLKRYNETYTPTVISEDLYNEILKDAFASEDGDSEDTTWVCPYLYD